MSRKCWRNEIVYGTDIYTSLGKEKRKTITITFHLVADTFPGIVGLRPDDTPHIIAILRDVQH